MGKYSGIPRHKQDHDANWAKHLLFFEELLGFEYGHHDDMKGLSTHQFRARVKRSDAARYRKALLALSTMVLADKIKENKDELERWIADGVAALMDPENSELVIKEAPDGTLSAEINPKDVGNRNPSRKPDTNEGQT